MQCNWSHNRDIKVKDDKIEFKDKTQDNFSKNETGKRYTDKQFYLLKKMLSPAQNISFKFLRNT